MRWFSCYSYKPLRVSGPCWFVVLCGVALVTGCVRPLTYGRLNPVEEQQAPPPDSHIFAVDARGLWDGAHEPNEYRHCEVPNEPAENDLTKPRNRFACILKAAIERYTTWKARSPAGGDERVVAPPILKMSFYFNGGLNTREDARKVAVDTYRLAEADRIFPVYMIWPTGGLRSYAEDVGQVRNGRWTRIQEPGTLITDPLRPPSDLIVGLGNTPAAWATSLNQLGKTSFGVGNRAFSLASDEKLLARSRIAYGSNLFFNSERVAPDGPIVADELYRDRRTGASAARFGDRTYYAITAPVRALTTPLALGFGEPAWRNMVRRTRTSIHAVTEFPDEGADAVAGGTTKSCVADPPTSAADTAVILRDCFPRGAGGFSRAFQWLAACYADAVRHAGARPPNPLSTAPDGCPLGPLSPEQRDALQNLRITMIGHSMGTIVLNELVGLYPKLPYEALVYMAGAASIRDTQTAIVPVLRDNRGCTKFFGLMLHPMNEARESSGHGLILSGSLLSLVDEFLEKPKTLGDRTIGQWRNLKMALHYFPPDVQRWMLLRVFDRAQAVSAEGKAEGNMGYDGWVYPNPTTHGEFNDQDVPFWRETFWRPVAIHFDPPAARSCEKLFAEHAG